MSELLGRSGRTPSINDATIEIFVRHHQKNENGDDGDEESERTRDAVPLAGHPHPKPLTPNRHEPDLPEQKAERQSGDGESFGAIECPGVGADSAKEPERTDPTQCRHGRFRGNDDGISSVVKQWISDRPVGDRGIGEYRVHRQDVLNESEITAVVGHVSECEEAGE